jgi:hypothetical protein
MDLNSITTPAELVEQNKTPEFNEDQERCIKLLDDVLEEGPKVGLVLTKIIIEKLVDMHSVNVEDRVGDNKIEEALLWQSDLVKLQMIHEALKTVEL